MSTLGLVHIPVPGLVQSGYQHYLDLVYRSLSLHVRRFSTFDKLEKF